MACPLTRHRVQSRAEQKSDFLGDLLLIYGLAAKFAVLRAAGRLQRTEDTHEK